MVQHWNYSLGDLESMIAWERLYWVDMLNQYIEEKKQEAKNHG